MATREERRGERSKRRGNFLSLSALKQAHARLFQRENKFVVETRLFESNKSRQRLFGVIEATLRTPYSPNYDYRKDVAERLLSLKKTFGSGTFHVIATCNVITEKKLEDTGSQFRVFFGQHFDTMGKTTKSASEEGAARQDYDYLQFKAASRSDVYASMPSTLSYGDLVPPIITAINSDSGVTIHSIINVVFIFLRPTDYQGEENSLSRHKRALRLN